MSDRSPASESPTKSGLGRKALLRRAAARDANQGDLWSEPNPEEQRRHLDTFDSPGRYEVFVSAGLVVHFSITGGSGAGGHLAAHKGGRGTTIVGMIPSRDHDRVLHVLCGQGGRIDEHLDEGVSAHGGDGGAGYVPGGRGGWGSGLRAGGGGGGGGASALWTDDKAVLIVAGGGGGAGGGGSRDDGTGGATNGPAAVSGEGAGLDGGDASDIADDQPSGGRGGTGGTPDRDGAGGDAVGLGGAPGAEGTLDVGGAGSYGTTRQGAHGGGGGGGGGGRRGGGGGSGGTAGAGGGSGGGGGSCAIGAVQVQFDNHDATHVGRRHAGTDASFTSERIGQRGIDGSVTVDLRDDIDPTAGLPPSPMR